MLKMDHELMVWNVNNISLHEVTPESPIKIICCWDSSIQFSRYFEWSSGPALFRLKISMSSTMAEGCFQVAYLNASENQHFLIVRKARPFLINSLFYPIFWSARWLKYVIQYFCNCYGIYLHYFIFSSLYWSVLCFDRFRKDIGHWFFVNLSSVHIAF